MAGFMRINVDYSSGQLASESIALSGSEYVESYIINNSSTIIPRIIIGQKFNVNLKILNNHTLPSNATAKIIMNTSYVNETPYVPLLSNGYWVSTTGFEYEYDIPLRVKPAYVRFDSTIITEGAVGALSANTWGWNPTNSTLHIRLLDSTNPNLQADGYVSFKDVNPVTVVRPIIEIDESLVNLPDTWRGFNSTTGAIEYRDPVSSNGEFTFPVSGDTYDLYVRLGTSESISAAMQVQIIDTLGELNSLVAFTFSCRNKFYGSTVESLGLEPTNFYSKAEIITLNTLKLDKDLSGYTGKTTAIDADLIPLSDSADTFTAKKLTMANLWAYISSKASPLYQPLKAGLTSLGNLTTAADKLPYTTAANTYATTDLTAAGRAILDDANAAAQRDTLGLGTAATTAASAYATAAQGTAADDAKAAAITNATNANTVSTIVKRDASGNFSAGIITAALTGVASGNLVAGGALGTPSDGTLTNCTFPTLNQNTTGTAANVTGTVAVANGGTGATTAAAARTNLGTPALNGFENRTDSALAMNSANLEVSKTGSGFNIWTNGTKYAYTTTQSVEIATDQALHYVYFNTSGVLSVSTSAWGITSDNVPVATVYKDGATYAIQDERHNYKRNREWHKWAHDTIGTRYESGLTGTFTNTTLSIVQGEIHDEDINFDTGGTKTACRLWHRNTGLTSMRFENNISTPYKAAAGTLQYDNAGTLANVDSNKYACNYVYAAADSTYPIQTIVGQAQHSNLSNAQSEALPLILMSTVEWKLLYKVIYRNVGGTPTYISAADFRTVSTGPAMTAVANSHAALINRDAADSHPHTAISGLGTAATGTTGTASGNIPTRPAAESLSADHILPVNDAHGVDIDGVLCKDGKGTASELALDNGANSFQTMLELNNTNAGAIRGGFIVFKRNGSTHAGFGDRGAMSGDAAQLGLEVILEDLTGAGKFAVRTKGGTYTPFAVNEQSVSATTVETNGVKLPDTPGSADANTLDCYKEGVADTSWTPTLTTDGTQWTTPPTYTATGTYTRVGRLINFVCYVAVSSIDNTGATGNSVRVSLPFAPAKYTPVAFYGERILFSVTWQWLTAYAAPTGYLGMLTQGNNLDSGVPPVDCLRNGASMTFSGTYSV